MQEVYLWAVGNLSLINHLKRMVGDGIRLLDVMIKAPSVKQEPPIFRKARMSKWRYMVCHRYSNSSDYHYIEEGVT